ncbi:oligoendopeptidase F [Youngiibacter multivorans]|uniref:Oligopeptidase F n=1 Tax=Youngiibacter multivorans TaxID=937251 RepID=A0ABS4G3U5_9CLOT|nr:oligoendopeptidase F [Youngiibacter multivorans]MBP1919204.1 oligoendopeptidase F [Youngiibacter multivorans]
MDKIPSRNEVDDRHKWRLDLIFESNADFEEELKAVKAEAGVLSSYKDRLGDKEALLGYLKDYETYGRRLEKLYSYAHMKSDEDTTNGEQQVLLAKVSEYYSELMALTSWFVPEILALPDERLNEYLTDPDLELYRFHIESIAKDKPHVLSKEREELLASLGDSLSAPEKIYNMFSNADLTFGNVKDSEGSEHQLTEEKYRNFIQSKDRVLRKNSFLELFTTYGKYKNTLAQTLTSSMKVFNIDSKLRKYSSPVERALSPNNIPEAVFHNSIGTINEGLKELHRYVDIKKKLLGLDEIHMYDLYVPVIDIPEKKISFEEGVAMSLEGLKPLGEEYLSIFKEGIEGGWIDIYENKGKRSGAYSSGCFDTMPYILLNYHDDLRDVSTLVHEMGHSIHSYYSRKTQPYIYAGYTIFVAEVASTTNEKLLIHHQIKTETDEKRKLYLINQELEQIRTTVFRQLMFAEFEKITHESLIGGTPLTGDDLNRIWLDLNRRYFGEGIVLDKEIESEWSRIPHFYSDFYVYQYATGYAAASAFCNMILEGKEGAVEKYLGFLKAGGSGYPVDVLASAGVDMTSKAPLEATVKRFAELLDMLEEVVY